MTDASERERLIALMSNRCPDGCRCSFQLTADMLRADAKVADALRDAEQRELAALQELDEASAQLAAQSAELERVRNVVMLNHQHLSNTDWDFYEASDMRKVNVATLVDLAPSAAGGEKEG